MSAGFLLLTIFLVIPLVIIQATADFTMFTCIITGFFFFWQRRAARKGFLMPPIIIALFLLAEFSFFSIVPDVNAYTGLTKHARLERVLSVYVSKLTSAFGQGFTGVSLATEDLLNSGRESIQAAFDSLGSGERKIAMLEEAFSNEPGNPAVVLALGDAYMARNDLVSTRLAIALYEALVETEVSDAFLARLADAYSRIYRYDLAFSTAVKRTWLPHAMMHRAARQIAFFAVTGGDLPRGIFELENILRLDPVESEEIMLILAGLYQDFGNSRKAQELLDQIIASTPATAVTAKTALQLRQAAKN